MTDIVLRQYTPDAILHRRLDMLLADKTRTSRSVGMQAEKSASEARIVKALGIHQVHVNMPRAACGLGCYTQTTWLPTWLPRRWPKCLSLAVVMPCQHVCRSTWYCPERLGSKGGAKLMVHLRKRRMTMLMFRRSAPRIRSAISPFVCA
jgi:hypothetical protein